MEIASLAVACSFSRGCRKGVARTTAPSWPEMSVLERRGAELSQEQGVVRGAGGHLRSCVPDSPGT